MSAKHYIYFGAAILVFLAISVPVALCKIPSDDEAWFASSAINLLREGHMGNTVKESMGGPFLRMNEHTYWQPPMDFLAQAGWYSIFGFSLFTERSLSIFWGVVALFSTLYIVVFLTNSRTAGLLAIGFLAIDFNFIDSATDGRMDMMCVALALAGYASYLSLRLKNLSWAMLAGNTFIALSGLTHAHGIVHLAGFVTLVLFLDRKNIRARHIVFGLMPYVADAIGWGLYIIQDSEAFGAQFLGHVSRKLASEGGNIFMVLWSEIADRYLFSYGVGPAGTLLTKLKILILIGYVSGVLGLVWSMRRNRAGKSRLLLILLGLYFVLQTFIIQEKSHYYLVHIIPIYAMILGVAVVESWGGSVFRKGLIAIILIIFCILQIGVSARVFLRNDYRNRYMPIVNEIRKLDHEGLAVMGTAELAFELGFSPEFIDDPALGYFSGRRADIIAVNEVYERWFGRFERQDRELYEYVRHLLDDECEIAYQGRDYTLYVRRQ